MAETLVLEILFACAMGGVIITILNDYFNDFDGGI